MTASKYVNETGPGYLGIIKLNSYTLQIPYGSWSDYNWQQEDDLWVVDDDRGVAIVDEEPEDSLDEPWILLTGHGPKVCVPGYVIRRHLDIPPNVDVRIYARDDGAMLVVPAHPDPMLGGESSA